MLETLKHTLGLCGEPHPSLLWAISSGGFILYIIKHHIRYCWKKGCDFCKAKVKGELK